MLRANIHDNLRKSSFDVLEDEPELLRSTCGSQTDKPSCTDQCEETDYSLRVDEAFNLSASLSTKDAVRDFWKRVAAQKQQELEKLKSENSILEDKIFDSDERRRELTEKYDLLMKAVVDSIDSSENSEGLETTHEAE